MSKARRKAKVLDLFAGAGGFGLGFCLANNHFKVICSLEIDQWAIKTLKKNNKEKQKIIHADIRDFNTDKKIRLACPSTPDVIIGGPPCQGFSTAGPTKDPKDPRNSLFKNFAHWVEVLQPKVFVMENVPGLLNGKNEKGEKVIDIIKRTFIELGYAVNIWELNAANFGVPQNRQRVFIVGNKFGSPISEPKWTHYLPEEKKQLNGKARSLKKAITVQKAIGDLPKLKAGEGDEEAVLRNKPTNPFQKLCRKNTNKLYNHVTMAHTKRVVGRYEQILNGYDLKEIPEELQVRKRNGNGELSDSEYESNYRHLRPNMIAYTIPASFYSNFIHPKQPRNITAREAARIQSFPDAYVFKGKRTQISSKLLQQLGKDEENFLSQYNQIGNAVPPLLAKVIANRVFKFIEKEKRKNRKKKGPNKKSK